MDFSQLGLVEMIDVSNARAMRQSQREVQCSDLDSISLQESQCDVGANRLTIRQAAAQDGISRLALTAP
jgi:hypothetical protein